MTEPAPTPPTPPAPPAPVTFTPEQQAAVDAIVQGRVASTARTAAAARELEINDYLAAQQAEAELANMAEIDRLRAEAANAQAAAQAAQAERDAAAARVAATTALIGGGLNPAHLDDAIRLIDPASDDLPAAVTALATRLPALFTPTVSAPPPRDGITPPTPPRSVGGGQSAAERAKARFKPKFAPPAA